MRNVAFCNTFPHRAISSLLLSMPVPHTVWMGKTQSQAQWMGELDGNDQPTSCDRLRSRGDSYEVPHFRAC